MIEEEQQNDEEENAAQQKPKQDKLVFKMTNVPSPMPTKDRPNPHLNETYEPSGTHMNCAKQFKGHLMGVTSLSYNPKKDILATGSDDTTWKLWSVPSGDLIMSGEGHLDWIGGFKSFLQLYVYYGLKGRKI